MDAPVPLPPDLETERGQTDGLAWTRYAPAGAEAAPPAGGVVVIHGADSSMEAHADFARACAASGLAALAYDARGHGASGGALDGRAIDDVVTMAGVLRERGGVRRIGLRGSSMGGYFALVAAAAAGAGAVVAICPAPATGLIVGIRGRFGFASDRPSLTALLRAHDQAVAAAALTVPLLLQHAEGDEVLPVELSRELAAAAPRAQLTVAPGGDHRSVQHDPRHQAEAVAFLARHLG
jgi:pimeloyl-ACP methyl ester carboxylesterase